MTEAFIEILDIMKDLVEKTKESFKNQEMTQELVTCGRTKGEATKISSNVYKNLESIERKARILVDTNKPVFNPAEPQVKPKKKRFGKEEIPDDKPLVDFVDLINGFFSLFKPIVPNVRCGLDISKVTEIETEMKRADEIIKNFANTHQCSCSCLRSFTEKEIGTSFLAKEYEAEERAEIEKKKEEERKTEAKEIFGTAVDGRKKCR